MALFWYLIVIQMCLEDWRKVIPWSREPQKEKVVETAGDYKPGGYFWARQDIWNTQAPSINTAQKISYDPKRFPSNTVITWDWPSVAANGSPWSYPGLDWGNQEPGVRSPPAKQLKDFVSLATHIDYSVSASAKEMDILHEMWLYANPAVGKPGDPIFEIEILLVPMVTPLPASLLIFDITSPFKAGVYFQPSGWRPSFLISPNTNLVGKISIDWLSIYKQLIAHGRLTGNEYAYGFELGVEPRVGKGTMKINSFSVDWK